MQNKIQQLMTHKDTMSTKVQLEASAKDTRIDHHLRHLSLVMSKNSPRDTGSVTS